MSQDDDINIYEDIDIDGILAQCKIKTENGKAALEDELHSFNRLHNLEARTKQLEEENGQLKSENEELKKTMAMRDKQLKVLKNNISSLYKTAKLELDRRQQLMADLQNKYDQLVFRRNDLAKENSPSVEPATTAAQPDKEAPASGEKRPRDRNEIYSKEKRQRIENDGDDRESSAKKSYHASDHQHSRHPSSHHR